MIAWDICTLQCIVVKLVHISARCRFQTACGRSLSHSRVNGPHPHSTPGPQKQLSCSGLLCSCPLQRQALLGPVLSMPGCPAGGGMPGMTAGDWLVSVGLDTAKAVRPKATTLNDVRRKQGRQPVSGSRTHLQRGLGGIKQVRRTSTRIAWVPQAAGVAQTHCVGTPKMPAAACRSQCCCVACPVREAGIPMQTLRGSDAQHCLQSCLDCCAAGTPGGLHVHHLQAGAPGWQTLGGHGGGRWPRLAAASTRWGSSR